MYVHQFQMVSCQPWSQRQGMRAAALLPPLARPGSLQQNTAGDDRAAQEENIKNSYAYFSDLMVRIAGVWCMHVCFCGYI